MGALQGTQNEFVNLPPLAARNRAIAIIFWAPCKAPNRYYGALQGAVNLQGALQGAQSLAARNRAIAIAVAIARLGIARFLVRFLAISHARLRFLVRLVLRFPFCNRTSDCRDTKSKKALGALHGAPKNFVIGI